MKYLTMFPFFQRVIIFLKVLLGVEVHTESSTTDLYSEEMLKVWLKEKDRIILEFCKRYSLDSNDPRYFREDPEEQQKVIAMIEEYNRLVKHEAECSVMA